MNELEKVNYHCHCERCRHAMGAAGEYAREAAEKKLVRLGISDHLPYPDDRFGYRMPFAELEDYFQEVADLKQEYRGRLDIVCGLEGEYFEKDRRYYERLLSHEKCSYLLLGQHFYIDGQENPVNVYQLESTVQYEEYANAAVEGMKTGYFKYLAHPDLMFINDLAWDAHCDRACDIIIDGAVKYRFPLEYNANGFRRQKQKFVDGERYPYPHSRFWDKVKGTEIQVYVGSDCHEPSQVYDRYVEMAYEKLADAGIAVRTDWEL